MAIDSVKTKLHEARSALSEMRDEEGKAAGESRYDHRLNAFLSAARSVDYRLRSECPNTYPDWRKQWDAQHPAEDSLLVFINFKRADDVHTCSAPWLPQGFGAVHNAQTPQGPTQLL